jgi:chromosome segregation ATPase
MPGRISRPSEDEAMTDPIGTVGMPRSGTPAAPESDLGLAVMGGPKFLDRLKQLADASDRHEHAFAMLKLGEDILSQRADAQQKLADAEQKKAEAQAVLDKAKADSEALMAKAVQVNADADKYAAGAKLNADGVVGAAREELSIVERKRAEVEGLIEQANAAKAEAERATKAANDRHAELKSKIARLHSFIEDVTG